MAIDIKKLLTLFYEEYVCDWCAKRSASHLETCDNPLHELHEAFYQLEDK
jgi:hypothetical protein